MRAESRSHTRLLVLPIAALFACSVVPASEAGEVHGTVTQRAYQAHVGKMLGGMPGSDAVSVTEPAFGPVLIYVGEASMQLPHRETAPARLRMTGGGLNPTL